MTVNDSQQLRRVTSSPPLPGDDQVVRVGALARSCEPGARAERVRQNALLRARAVRGPCYRRRGGDVRLHGRVDGQSVRV